MEKNKQYEAEMRAAFEDDMSSQWEWPQAVEKNAQGDYILMTTASAWETWQRAWEAAKNGRV